MSEITSIGVLGYQDCSEQDTITPIEIFRGAAMALAEQKKELNVKLVAVAEGNVKMQMGTVVVPDKVLSDDDEFDILYVPGGVGTGEMTRTEKVLNTIRRHHENGKIIGSNCSGIGILHRSGILGQTPVTCVAAIARRLREEGTNVPQPRRTWHGVPEARIWTTTGSYGVHGSSVALVAHYFGRDVATTCAMMFDTLGGLGEAIFELQGPEFYFHPQLESDFQDFWEDRLLPKLS